MSENTAVQVNVDTFSDGDGYFVRTEIEARCVTIHGPFADSNAAQSLKAEQLSYRGKAIDTIRKKLQDAASSFPAGN
jgi:hypothetical protein